MVSFEVSNNTLQCEKHGKEEGNGLFRKFRNREGYR